MIHVALLEKLVSPSGNHLVWDTARRQLRDTQTGDTFDVVDGMPILLPVDAGERSMEVILSNGLRAKFYYADHYLRDAEFFDYSEAMPDGASRHENRRLHEMILAKIPPNITSILDVGCGSAWVAAHFAASSEEIAVCSMDISLTNPLRALKAYPFAGHSAVVADVYALPFRDHSFDCIIAAEVMEHTPDPKLFITNLLRVLKPGGTLIITTPYNEQIPHSLCVHCNHPTPHNAHLHTINEEKIEAILAGQALESWKMNTFANKFMIKLRMHLLLQYLPLKIWKAIDDLANLLYPKPLRLLLKVTKSNS